MAFPGSIYAPPGVYTQTLFENPLSGNVNLLRIPVFIGEGSESLAQSNLYMVRGSAADRDQKVAMEDATGRAVTGTLADGSITLGVWDGSISKFQVRNYPLVDGSGAGTTTNDRSSVQVFVNNKPVVIRSVAGLTGVVELAAAPKEDDVVRCTYFFNRTDTLVTDNVSSQITAGKATMYGEVGILDTEIGGTEVFKITEDSNDSLTLTVDGTEYTIEFPEGSYTANQMKTLLNSAGAGTLLASYAKNNQGKNALILTADVSIAMGSDTATSTLGLVSGLETSRNATFFTHNGPIVDGTNGGVAVVAATKSAVVVKVDGVQVIPASVDGKNRKVVLSTPPKDGSVVTVTYYYNTWEDTFDYLAHINVTAVTMCGDQAPDRNDFIDGESFVLKDDKIVWGTAALVSSKDATSGSTEFGSNQITTSLVDDQFFMAPCTPLQETVNGLKVDSLTKFTLPAQPTSGNGRNFPLGSSMFTTLVNGRVDLPTNRPDLVTAYWGYGVQDAQDRGAVAVTSVDYTDSTFTLASGVPTGATVYATFYYNNITDSEYTITADTSGASGTGEYSMVRGVSTLTTIFHAKMDRDSKSVNLASIDVLFPSGTELTQDTRMEASQLHGADASFTGSVEETATVTFGTTQDSPAKIAVSNASPYYFVESKSDNALIKIDGSQTYTIDLSDPHATSCGVLASLIGDEIPYGATAFTQNTIDSTNRELAIAVDAQTIEASANSGNDDVTEFVDRLNEASHGISVTASATGTTTTAIDTTAGYLSDIDDYYVGWEVVVEEQNSGSAVVVGEKQTVTAYDAATNTLTFGAFTAEILATDKLYLYNPSTQPTYYCGSKFLSGMKLGGGEGYHQLTIEYYGAVAGAMTETISFAGTYTSASAIASEIQTQLDAVGCTAYNGTNTQANFTAPEITVTADSSGRIKFSFRRAATDVGGGYFAFTEDSTPHDDFATLACIDANATGAGGAGVHILHGDIATYYRASGPTKHLNDRLILRNRLVPGGGSGASSPAGTTAHNVLSQCKLQVKAGTANTICGLTLNATGSASAGAVVNSATLVADIGNSLQDTASGSTLQGEAAVVFYNGDGTKAANNVLDITVDGKFVQVEFTATDSGTTTPIGSGDARSSINAASVIGQIKAAANTAYPNHFGVVGSATMDAFVRREGFGIRFSSLLSTSKSKVLIGTGSANSTLGLTDGSTALRSATSTAEVASILMGDVASFGDYLLGATQDYGANGSSVTGTDFTAKALALVIEDSGGQDYLYIQSKSVGATSSVVLDNAASNDWLSYGTLIGVTAGDSANGEDGINGFFVTSNNSAGSGSKNNSVLNNGTGQDGVIGQTYQDAITGLTFTILPRNGGGDYPATGTFNIDVSSTFTTDANYPVNIPGIELTVANTYGVSEGDTATLETFSKTGDQPLIGGVYYVSYTYSKQDYETKLFSKLSAIVNRYGAVHPDNPLSLAAYLAILNGATIVGMKQITKDSDNNSTQASVASYIEAVDALEGRISSAASPSVLVPLRGDSSDLFSYISKHCDIQSSIRYRSERTALLGMGAGTEPSDVTALAQVLGNTRVRIVYPDSAIVPLADNNNDTTEYFIEGPFIAAAMVGNRVSPNRDVATPWTGAQLVGFSVLGRDMDAVEMNQIATKGVTILTTQAPFLKVRHGLTTDMTNVLTKTPTVIQISDHVQKNARAVLGRFIGLKFLPTILTQVEGRLAQMFIGMVNGQIVAAYTGIAANVSADDPTVAEVEAYYQPVFPLLYLVLTFNLRSSL